MTKDNTSASETERAAVENKSNARPEERLCSPLIGSKQNTIVQSPPLKSEAPLSVLHSPPVLPPRSKIEYKRQQHRQRKQLQHCQQHTHPSANATDPSIPLKSVTKSGQGSASIVSQQPDSFSGSGFVNAIRVDHGSTLTVAVERPPGQPTATASSSVTNQAAFDDAKKSGARDAGGDGASSPNPDDVATTPSGSEYGGLNLVETATPEFGTVKPQPINTAILNRMERAEWGDDSCVDTPQSVSSPEHSVFFFPSSPQHKRSRSLQEFLDACDQRDHENQQAADDILLALEQYYYELGQANDTAETIGGAVNTEEAVTVDEETRHGTEIRNHSPSNDIRATPSNSPRSQSNASNADVAVGMSSSETSPEFSDTQCRYVNEQIDSVAAVSIIPSTVSKVELDLVKFRSTDDDVSSKNLAQHQRHNYHQQPSANASDPSIQKAVTISNSDKLPLPSSTTFGRGSSLQLDSASGSEFVNAITVDHGPTLTVAVGRPAGKPNATTNSSINRKSLDDDNKSGSRGAGSDVASSPNPGDAATTPTGSATSDGLNIALTRTSAVTIAQPKPSDTVQLDRMERGELGDVSCFGTLQSVPSPEHSGSVFPSISKRPAGLPQAIMAPSQQCQKSIPETLDEDSKPFLDEHSLDIMQYCETFDNGLGQANDTADSESIQETLDEDSKPFLDKHSLEILQYCEMFDNGLGQANDTAVSIGSVLHTEETATVDDHMTEIRNHSPADDDIRAAPAFSPSSPWNASNADVAAAVGLTVDEEIQHGTEIRNRSPSDDIRTIPAFLPCSPSNVSKTSLVESDQVKFSITANPCPSTGLVDEAVKSLCLPSENSIEVPSSNRGESSKGGRRNSDSESNIRASTREPFASIGRDAESASNTPSTITTSKVPSEVSVERSNLNKISPLAEPIVSKTFSHDELPRMSDNVGGFIVASLEADDIGSVPSDEKTLGDETVHYGSMIHELFNMSFISTPPRSSWTPCSDMSFVADEIFSPNVASNVGHSRSPLSSLPGSASSTSQALTGDPANVAKSCTNSGDSYRGGDDVGSFSNGSCPPLNSEDCIHEDQWSNFTLSTPPIDARPYQESEEDASISTCNRKDEVLGNFDDNVASESEELVEVEDATVGVGLSGYSPTLRVPPDNDHAIEKELVLLFATIIAELSQIATFLKKCITTTDGSCYYVLEREEMGAPTTALSLSLDALFRNENKFSDLLRETLGQHGTIEEKRAFVIEALVRYTRSQAKAALGLQDSDHFGSVYVTIAGTVQEIIMYVHEKWWQCIIALQHGQLPPVLFKKTKPITNVGELRKASVEWGRFSDKFYQELDKNRACHDLVKEHGNLLAGPGDFEPIHDPNGGAMDVGSFHCLRGDIYHKRQLKNGSCQFFCVVGRKDQVTDEIDDQALFHRAAIIADIFRELCEVNTYLDQNDIQALISLLHSAIVQSRCDVPDTFYKAMIVKGPGGRKLVNFFKRAYKMTQQQFEF